MAHNWRTVTYRIGLVLLWLGIYVAGFAFYEISVTNVGQASAQKTLTSDITQTLPRHIGQKLANPVSTLPSGLPMTIANVKAVPLGSWVGSIDIPKLAVHQIVVQGVGADQLRVGPGHYPGTPSLGAAGNVAIAGHRTTWGKPFRHLDELRPGDAIVITTPQAQFLYRVNSNQVVAPTDVAVLRPTLFPTLTLTTCNPPYSAQSRIVVTARLMATDRFVGAPRLPTAPPPQHSHDIASAAIDAAGGGGGWWPVVLDATLLVLLIPLGLRWRKRSRNPMIVTALLAVVAVPITIDFYSSLSWLLPPGL